jgi:ubiquinone/menaquinone biosynthesis C-methylase UbiE
MAYMATDAFEYYWQEYDRWYEKHAAVYLSELEVVRGVLPKEGAGVEIGVGTGRFALPLGIRVGVDLSMSMLNLAKKRGIQTVCADAHHLPFKNESFDFAVLVVTLCFLQNPRQAMEETRRVLRSRGTIIIGIIDRDSFLGRLYELKKSKFYEAARFFSVPEVTELLQSVGFSAPSYEQTIFKHPHELKQTEQPKPGYGEGGFVIISAFKE